MIIKIIKRELFFHYKKVLFFLHSKWKFLNWRTFFPNISWDRLWKNFITWTLLIHIIWRNVCIYVCRQERAEMLLLRYASRWLHNYVRRRLDLTVDSQDRTRMSPMATPLPPRHCISARCPCQFIEEHLKYKPKGKLTLSNFFKMPNFGFEWEAHA